MAEYIKQKIQGGKKSICDSCTHRNVCKAIDNQPCTECNHYQCTADVEPVRHGRWNGDTCTSCNLPWNYNMTQNAQDWGYFDPMPDYCPNCGARMDEEVKHER